MYDYFKLSAQNCIKKKIKKAEQKDLDLTTSHKSIKNTFTCGTVLTEHLLNSGGRAHTTKATLQVTM